MARRTLIRFSTLVSPTDDDQELPQENPTDFQIDSLPDPIFEEILLRVPAKTAFVCKTVSKLWLSIVSKPVFARNHFSKAPVCPLLVFHDHSRSNSTRIMHLVEGQTISDLDRRITQSRLTSEIDFSRTKIGSITIASGGYFLPVNTNITSCEGMTCWALNSGVDDHIFLCNPITGEYVKLEPAYYKEEEDEFIYVFIGLGFCRATRKFELLRMCNRAKTALRSWWPEVCTIGSHFWRRVGDATCQLDLMRRVSEVVYVNGAIYWRYDGDNTICYYNFDNVSFQVVPLPKMNLLMLETNIDSAPINMSLGVLDNSLCISLISPEDGHVELWVVEIGGGVCQVSWNKVYDVESVTTKLEHSGMLGSRGQYKAIKYLNDGEIMMQDWRETFMVYDPKTQKEMHFRVMENSSLEDRRTLLQVVPHVPCLVTLKDALNLEG